MAQSSLFGNFINGSPYDEQNPVISPDGTMMFLTIANHPNNIDGKRDPGDIWISFLKDNQWSAPVHGGAAINDKAYNTVVGVSRAGDELYLMGHYMRQGPVRSQGFSVSKHTASGWSFPENVSIPYFQNKSNLQSGYVSPDGNVFVFSAETYGTYGVEDIYVSLRGADGRWTDPKNLGRTINTQFQELTPSLSDDGRTLFFSSNGRKGHGSFDVYTSTRLDESWLQWSEPSNLGSAINTSGRDLYYRTYGEFSLYTSTSNSDIYGDVRFYQPTEQEQPPAETEPVVQAPAQLTERINESSAAVTVRIYGTVTNATTQEVVAATLVFESDSAHVTTRTNNGAGYSLTVPSVKSYHIRIEAPGFVSASEKLDLNTVELRDVEMNFKLQPVKVGTTVNLKSVLFVQGKVELLPESYAELDVVAGFLKDNPTIAIELAGHTDNRGLHSHNVRLSQARVNTVKEYLVSKGISPKRITGKGYGGLRPIADNNNELTRALNRRVEFIIRKL